MKERSLGIKPRKRFVKVPGKQDDLAVFPNLYRNVIPAESDRVWVADITVIRIVSGFVFLAAILDACSRKVVGYARFPGISTRI
jgi:putative transposase